MICNTFNALATFSGRGDASSFSKTGSTAPAVSENVRLLSEGLPELSDPLTSSSEDSAMADSITGSVVPANSSKVLVMSACRAFVLAQARRPNPTSSGSGFASFFWLFKKTSNASLIRSDSVKVGRSISKLSVDFWMSGFSDSNDFFSEGTRIMSRFMVS